jgi:hypothetical protein
LAGFAPRILGKLHIHRRITAAAHEPMCTLNQSAPSTPTHKRKTQMAHLQLQISSATGAW